MLIQRVLDLEAGDLLRDSISEQPFWASYIEDSNRADFKVFARRLDATTEFYSALDKRANEPGLSIEETARLNEEIRVLGGELGKQESEFAAGQVMTEGSVATELNQIDEEGRHCSRH